MADKNINENQKVNQKDLEIKNDAQQVKKDDEWKDIKGTDPSKDEGAYITGNQTHEQTGSTKVGLSNDLTDQMKNEKQDQKIKDDKPTAQRN